MSVQADKNRRKELGKKMRSEVQSHFENANPTRTVWEGGRAFTGTPDNYQIVAKRENINVSFTIEMYSGGRFRYVVQDDHDPSDRNRSSFSDLSEAIAYGKKIG